MINTVGCLGAAAGWHARRSGLTGGGRFDRCIAMQSMRSIAMQSMRSMVLASTASLLIHVATATPAAAQSTASATAPAATGKVIVTAPPRQSSRLRTLLSKLLGKDKREKLAATQAEVWTVTQSRLGRLKLRFKALGVKVTQLREDWNHILKRQQGPQVMTPAQEAIMKKVKPMREIIGVGVMTAGEAAMTEYALTAGAK
ncbi:MAG: hypothetical protein WAO08_05025, partial [Hyphomicrobiaceae bacterium]